MKKTFTLLEWSLIPWKNKDYSFGHGNKYPLGLRTWFKINGGLVEISIDELNGPIVKRDITETS